MQKSQVGEEKEEAAYDVFRDSPVRLLGYANEVGEAFRPVFPQLVVPSYCIAFGYVLADTGHKVSAERERKHVAAIDTLAWQTLASVALPGLVINRVVWASNSLLQKSALAGKPSGRWAPVFLGLATIPFIVEPIDDAVHKLMDATLRPYLK